MATIQGFEQLKAQLAELAKVVNAFNSEAVQLRIIEILLSEYLDVSPDKTGEEEPKPPIQKKKKSASKAKSSKNPGGESKKPKSKSTGPATILNTLIDEGFFSKHQTINNIIDHAKVQKATVLKPNELSPTLGRFVRDQRLKREKNSDGQYEYFTK